MTTITGLTASRMLGIEAASVVGGEVIGDDLILERHDGTTINAGEVRGDQGPTGSPGFGVFPGMVTSHALAAAPSGWLNCDGTDYLIADYPTLSSAIGTTYNTMAGASAPAAGRFRVPNLKGRVPTGRDSGQTEFDTLAEVGGTKTHTIGWANMPANSFFVQGAAFSMANGSVPNFSVAGGLGTAINHLSPYAVLNFAIYAGV